MAVSRVSIWAAFLAFLVFSSLSPARSEEAGAEAVEEAGAEAVEESAVLTLDASNFSDTVAQHPFIVVEFYAPWCGHCKKLAPEYEKAASILSKLDPPIILAKVDVNDEKNKELAEKYEVRGFPTLQILRNQGNNIQEYKGPREAEGIVQYVKKQYGPASSEIKSSEDVGSLIEDKKIIFIVGVFPDYSREEFKNFLTVAEKLRSDYDFGHTLDAKFLPRGDLTVSGPIVRLFKPFDELFIDFQDFHVDALENFIEAATVPTVTTYDGDSFNHPYIGKFFNNPNAKALLFLNFSNEYFDAFKSKYHKVAELYKGKNISFLIADLDATQPVLEFFGLKEEQAPAILIQDSDGQKYFKPNLEPDQIATFVKDFLHGSLTPFKKSQPIPEVNNEPVKVVVGDSLHDAVFKSGKNVLLEFYAPWCGHCKTLAPILEEVAVLLQNDSDVIIAKMDATANDFPKEFDVLGFPTLYFSSASGKLVQYDGDRTKEDIISFIQKNKDATTQKDTTVESVSVKDEL